jgi:hypothetical protein
MKSNEFKEFRKLSAGLGVMFFLAMALVFTGTPAIAAQGDVLTTPATPMELPVEIEVETGPASLKQAPLWKELYQLLDDPYTAPVDGTTYGPSTIVRRPGFGVTMPPLNVWPLGYNFLTGQPLRLRTSDGEVSWDQPGFLFDPDEVVTTSSEPASPNVPTETRGIIGALATCIDDDGDVTTAEQQFRPGGPCEDAPVGAMVVSNPPQRGLRNVLGYTSLVCTGPGPNNGCADSRIPPHRTVVALAAVVDGVLHELDTDTGDLEPITELEIPINEEDFFRDPVDVTGVPALQQPYIGRLAAEVLGKAGFWDMQVGSDSVQSCGSCHFHAGVDNRTRNQLNPNHLGGDLTLQVTGPNQDVIAGDFPFRRLADVDGLSEGPGASAIVRDSNDVMSSMGVSKFTLFNDVPVGPVAFGAPFNGVAPLQPDLGTPALDPIPVFQPEIIGDSIGNEDGICDLGEACTSLRRVEPRHTPTFHGAAFNFDNFWDGRARFVFNGGSVFGASDPQAHIFIREGDTITGATNGHINEDLSEEDPEAAGQPVRIKFSSLASQAVGPPLSEFEMSFFGRNWPKIGKKLLQAGVTPLAKQLVDPDDSVLGPFSGQRSTIGGAVDLPGTPGLNISYLELLQLAFKPEFWDVFDRHLDGAPGVDPFDGYLLSIANGAALPLNTNQFTQAEANFSLFFALGVQAYEELTIPDDTLFDQFMDANPLAANAVGQPGEQGVLYPTLVTGLVGGFLNLIPDDPATPEYDGFGPDELFGWDIFAGSNATAALAPGEAVDPVSGINRNPAGLGSNPFARTSRCMLCHLGPEQTDHSINISHGVIKGDAEVEFPTPPSVIDPFGTEVPAPEPPGPIAAVGGLILSEEVSEGAAQDAVEVEPRNFATFDIFSTPWDDRIVAQPKRFTFGDQGVYNIGVRPNAEDIGRGGDDAFGWPLSLSALTLMNIGGQGFVPGTVMPNFDPFDMEATFEETGDGAFFPGTTHTLQSINPGFERDTIDPQMPDYMVPWIHSLPAGELHPSIDEAAGFLPNTLTQPNGGPAIEYGENLFGADLHCGQYDPAAFGSGSPNFGWGPNCPNNQSGVTGNIRVEMDNPYVPGSLVAPVHGSWPNPNQVLRDGAFKAPALRNVELTGPYFHTGSYLTLRQIVDFYIRGGDFPVTNADDRDPHMMDIEKQAFGFGTVRTVDDLGDPTTLGEYFDVTIDGVHLIGSFADALPDTAFQYDAMPDTDHLFTPEPATSTPEEAKVALVRFLLSLTDPRTKYERAPFDRPEIFVPIDGMAPENAGGRAELVAFARCSIATPCTLPGPDGILSTPDDIVVTEPLFRHLAAVGETGNMLGPDGIAGTPDDAPTAQPNFLGISSTPVPGPDNDHFDQ